MNTRTLCRLFALLLSAMLILGGLVAGTTAFVAAATPPVTNTFVYDPSVFPDVTPTPTPTPTPVPTPTPTPLPEINLPDTGDHSDLALWGAMLTLSLGGCLLLRRRAV